MKYAVCLLVTAAMMFATDVQAKKEKKKNVEAKKVEVSKKKKTSKKPNKDIYIFGCSASFTDSIVYITDIQVLYGISVNSKTSVLPNRDGYSMQLKEYLSNKMGQTHRTCFVMFSDKAKIATKKRLKMKTLYTTKAPGKYDVRFLTLDDFRFTIIHDDNEQEVTE